MKSEKERQIPYDITYDMWNLKYNSNSLIYKTDTDSQNIDNRLWLPRGSEMGVDGLRGWD